MYIYIYICIYIYISVNCLYVTMCRTAFISALLSWWLFICGVHRRTKQICCGPHIIFCEVRSPFSTLACSRVRDNVTTCVGIRWWKRSVMDLIRTDVIREELCARLYPPDVVREEDAIWEEIGNWPYSRRCRQRKVSAWLYSRQRRPIKHWHATAYAPMSSGRRSALERIQADVVRDKIGTAHAPMSSEKRSVAVARAEMWQLDIMFYQGIDKSTCHAFCHFAECITRSRFERKPKLLTLVSCENRIIYFVFMRPGCRGTYSYLLLVLLLALRLLLILLLVLLILFPPLTLTLASL